ncbi:hypothetical protein ACLB2K_063034 [Fragaria x ananassa]
MIGREVKFSSCDNMSYMHRLGHLKPVSKTCPDLVPKIHKMRRDFTSNIEGPSRFEKPDVMAREKKSVAWRNQSAFGFADSSTTSSPSEPLLIKDVKTSTEAGSEQAPGTQEDIRPEQELETQQAPSNQQAPATEEASSNPGESSLRDTKFFGSKARFGPSPGPVPNGI